MPLTVRALSKTIAPVSPVAPPSAVSGEAFASLMSRGNRDETVAGGGKDVPETRVTQDGPDPKSEAPVKARVQPRAERCAPPIVFADVPAATTDPASPPEDASPSPDTNQTSPVTDVSEPLAVPTPPVVLAIPATPTPAADLASTAPLIGSPAPPTATGSSEAPVLSTLPREVQPTLAGPRIDLPATTTAAPFLAAPATDVLTAAGREDRPAERPADVAHRTAAETLHAEAAPPTPHGFDTAAQLAQRIVGQARARPAEAPLETTAPAAPDPSAAVVALAAPIATPATGPAAPEPLRSDALMSPIDHIERLRDAADAVSTSIRLIPDALGVIDVSLTREGEVTHVHLAADQAATRTLLADAQPKLAEIADQRGVKLGRTQVETGDGGGQPAPQQHSQRQPAAPARTRAADGPAILATHRIA